MSFTAKLPSRTNYVDEVYKVLLDAISDGSLAPGTRITQEELAEQLDVSRSPVMARTGAALAPATGLPAALGEVGCFASSSCGCACCNGCGRGRDGPR